MKDARRRMVIRRHLLDWPRSMAIGTIVRVLRACAPLCAYRWPHGHGKEPVIAGMTFLSVLINRRNFLYHCVDGSAKSSTDCSERRTANRLLVEISPVMPRFNVVIPRARVIIRGRAVLTYISSHYCKVPRGIIVPAILFCRFATNVLAFNWKF